MVWAIPVSCEDIYLNNEAVHDKPGYYRNNDDNWVFCDMNTIGEVSHGDLMSSCAGVGGIWRKMASFDITTGDNCPSPSPWASHNGVSYCLQAEQILVMVVILCFIQLME